MLVKGIPSSAFLGARPKSQKESGQVTLTLLLIWIYIRFPFGQNSTEDGVPPGRVTAEGEDMGVVGGDHGESVWLPGQLSGSLDGPVEHHRLR